MTWVNSLTSFSSDTDFPLALMSIITPQYGSNVQLNNIYASVQLNNIYA